MPSDAFAAYQALQGRLGREPTLDELYRFLSSPPPGRILPPVYTGAEGAAGAADDPRVQSHLTQYELEGMVPDLRQVRESLLRQLLFGDLAPQGPGLRLRPTQRQQSPGHPFPFPGPPL